MRSRTVVLTAPEQLVVETRTVARPAAGEVLVRVSECGICGSDMKMWAGAHPFLKPPLLLGHEFHGTVAEAGAGLDGVSVARAGAAVSVFPPFGNCPDGPCAQCARGAVHLCEHVAFVGGQRPGGFSELVAVPAANLVAVDPRIPEPLRVLIEPLAVAVHAADRSMAAAGESCVIVGGGPIGVLVGIAIRARGVEQIIVTDLSDERLELAATLLAAEAINPSRTDLHARVRATFPGGADIAFDCVGGAETAATALAVTRRGGRGVLVGNEPRQLTVDGIALQRGERSLVGVQMYTREDYARAMGLLAAGVIPVDVPGLIRRYRLEEAPEAFAAVRAGEVGALKAVLVSDPASPPG